MFREITMSTLAVLMFASTGSAAVTAKETMTPEKLREKKMEKISVKLIWKTYQIH